MSIHLKASQARSLGLNVSGTSKYGVDQSDAGKAARTFQGRVYASKAEAAFAAHLELRKKTGLIFSWEPQWVFVLRVEDSRICNFVVDFLVMDLDGSSTVYEVKGTETEAYKLKLKLFRTLYPKQRYVIVKNGKETVVQG